MSSNKKSGSKVVIIGAGSVGASIAFAMSIKQLCTDLVIIDANQDKAEGEAMDIRHGLAFLGQMNVRSGNYEDCANSDVIIMAAGLWRKSGESRSDLARANCRTAKGITAEIMKHYTRGVILVVTNPVDVLTYKIQKWSGLPDGRVVGSGTVLDSNRFRSMLSKKLGVDVRNVHGYMIGEHGDSQFAAWSATNISGFNIDDYCQTVGIKFDAADKKEIVEHVKSAGDRIISLKGASFYGLTVSVITLVESLLHNQSTIRPVGSIMHGEYGLDDVVVNVPSVLGQNGVEKILVLDLTDEEKALLHLSAAQVKTLIDQVKDV
jgi:L-lactate dehydrogenase